jgi:hypothetical protein
MSLARAALAVLAFALPAAAHPQDAGAQWQFTLTPYIWLPNVDGTLKYSIPPGAGGAPEVGVGPNNYLENLSAALMLAGEARKGPLSIFSDLIYLDFNKEGSSVKSVNFGGSAVSTTANVSTQSSLTGVAWTIAASTTVAYSDRGSFDVLSGLRYLDIKAQTQWQLAAAVSGPGGVQTFPASGGVSRNAEIWDWIIGARGRVRIGEGRWFAPYYFDIGWGSSTPTWQLMFGVGYAFKWGDALLSYRHLAYDQSDDKLFQDFRFSGPAIGASFHF